MLVHPAVVQIVPRLGSLIDGVADYAKTLGAALEANEGIPTAFLCGDPQDSLGNKLAERSSRAIVSALENLAPAAVLLHFVNYGYARRGCPFWLIHGLARWKRRNPGARLVTMFHELYAFGPPWRSSFWLSPIQRYLARALWKITDGAVTNVGLYRRRLCDWRPAGERSVALLPVFSNFGEPAGSMPWSGRPARLVVLGRAEAAGRAYGPRLGLLLQACRALQIDEVIDIGPRTAAVPARLAHIPVTARGFLPAAEIAAILDRARAGFIDYPTDHLGKSTVFAAYAAHGVVPVVSCSRGQDEPGLAESVNYWSPSPGDTGRKDFEAIANRAAAWYAGHRLELQAREFARKLRP